MNLNYVVDEGNGLHYWRDSKDNLPGKGLQKIKEFSIYKLFSDVDNNFLKNNLEKFAVEISKETFYEIYPHMLLLKEFYKSHNKIRDSMRGDFLELMDKLLEPLESP